MLNLRYWFIANMKKTIIILLSFFIGLQSCKTEFEVNAPWKDITVVYGLLNQNDEQHVIKINKVFLGQADVNDMAQIRDSSEYGPNEIAVTIQRSLDGADFVHYANLTPFTGTSKPGGTFYGPEQTLYRFSDTLLPGYDYRLVITKESGQQVFAETKIIEKFKFAKTSYWNALVPKVSFYKDGNYFPFDHAFWKSAVNGRRYQLTVRFYYTEINLDTGKETIEKLDWIFPTVKAPDLEGDDEIGSKIDGEDFYRFIGNKLEPIPASDNIIRCIGRAPGGGHPGGDLDFIVDVAGEDFSTYLDVNEPATGIVQERPEYTNVFDDKGNEQAGFFSSRFSMREEGTRLSTSGIAGNSITELKGGQYTGDLGFIVKVNDSKCPL